MRPQEIIERKRDGLELSAEQIGEFIAGVCDGSWADYQVSALVMAMFLGGLNEKEQDTLTRAMLHSGEILDLSDIEQPKADKHSTGGVGDKTSIVIAPLAAACGVAVPMISGRGLGHTGGTLDKLESIAGYNVNLSVEEFKATIRECGFAMAGQTDSIAPADRKLYALRDATATVPYIPLIVASIMSKKLAEGLDALILDVKTGSGAFMKELDDASDLARALVRTGSNFGVTTDAIISDMSQPLGKYVGNAFETYECIKILRGEAVPGSEVTAELASELTARMLVLAGVAEGLDQGRKSARERLASGEALERLRLNIERQGGDPVICDRPEKLVATPLASAEVLASDTGYIAAIDTFAIGSGIVAAGGGRTRAEDSIDHAVAFESCVRLGDKVERESVVGIVHGRDADSATSIAASLSAAFRIQGEPPNIACQLICREGFR